MPRPARDFVLIHGYHAPHEIVVAFSPGFVGRGVPHAVFIPAAIAREGMQFVSKIA